MAKHSMKLSSEPFRKILNGTKIIESRLLDEKRQKINIGDVVVFTDCNDTTKHIEAKVIALYHYSNFNDLFSNFPPQEFGGTSKESLLDEIQKFYTQAEQEKFGVIGIKIKCL